MVEIPKHLSVASLTLAPLFSKLISQTSRNNGYS